MVSKNNWQYQQQRQAQRVPHYGLRKLSVGVASVLLSTTLYMGMSAHADTVVTPSETSIPSTMVTTPNSGATETTSKAASLSANDVNGADVTSTNSTSEVPTSHVTPVDTSVTPEKPVDSTADAKTGNETLAQPATPAPNTAPKPVMRAAVKPVVNAEATETTSGSFFSTTGSGSSNSKSEVTNITSTSVESDRSDVQLTNTSVALLEMVKPATAWQPEPTTNYSADHTAKIDMTNQPTTVQGDNWQMSLDKNYIKAGQNVTLTVKYEAQAGDTFVLDIGYPAGVNAQQLSSQIGTTSTKDNGLRTQVINVFKQAGTYIQTIKLNGWKGSAEGLKLLRHVFGDQTFDLTLKYGTSVENAQDVGRLYLTSSFTPTMNGTGRVSVDKVDAKYVPVLSTNNNYIFTVQTYWSDSGTVLEPSYNGDFVYSISVPKTFELDQAATEALYQQIHNNELFGNWGNRGSNVTASQAGVGAPVVVKASALDRVAWHYVGNEGVSFLGHFVDAPSVATTVTAEGHTTVSDTIGGHTQTIILPGLSAKVINATDYNYANSGDTVFSVSDYGDHNQLYQSHEVPMTGNGNSISLINDLALLNNSPFDVKNATITLTFGDGLHVDVDSVRNNSYISNLLADNYIHPNRESSLLVTYQDGTSETVPFNSKGDPTKNIKSITLARDWNASQMAGMHNDGIRGFVAKTYQDGSPVKVGDSIKVSLTVAGVDTAGHKVFKTVYDTLKVVDQQFAPLTTRSFYGGIDKTGLGDNPSGTINVHWDRTSGERGKIQLENPTLYFVMPNTVAEVKNLRWGVQKDAPGNAVPTLTSITYERSKDGKNIVAIMHFSGALIDQVPNQYVPLYFDTVNKDNVTNQQSEGYLYWTADNVNADGLTKIDPTRLDSQNKSSHLPADLSQEQLSKIYLSGPFWGSINMATGMYSTSATKTATTPWQTQTIVDYHGDGQADLGINLVNDTSSELHNVIAIINLPKASNNSNLTVNLTGNTVELIDPNTNSKLTDGVTVLYSTKPTDLSSNDLSSFVTADQVEDWSKVQAITVTLQDLGGMTSRQVQIPVVVNDLMANAGKAGAIGTRISADELKPIIVSANAENAAKLVVGGQATIQARLHYQDAQGKDHYVPLADRARAYDILQHHVLNASDFTPSATDLAQVSGYELSKATPTVVSGHAVIGQPVLAQADGSVLQFELVPSAQKLLINYVDNDDNQKVIKTDILTGKTGETQKINVVAPNNYVLVDSAANPSEYTFLASDNNPITIHLKHQRNTTQEQKTITRTIKVTQPDGTVAKQVQTVTLTRTATVDEVTSAVKYGAWSTGQWDAYQIPSLKGYTASQTDVAAALVDENTKDQTVEVSYTPNKQSTTIKYVDDKGEVVHTTTVTGATDQMVKVSNEVPAGWMITKGKVPSEITFGVEGHEPIEVTIAHQHVTVDPDHPQNNGTKLPDNSAETFSGVEANDLNKTITRTIKVTTPDGQTKTVAQTAKLTRTADVDEVTGEVTYGKWTTGKWSNYDVPTVPGYTASQNEVPATEVTSNTTDQTVDISYTANSQTIHINYVDSAGKIVHTTTITGKTGETVNLSLTVPDKYQLADGQQLPTTYTFTAGSGDVTIRLAHKVVQREATVDVQVGLMTFVDLDDEDEPGIVVTQNQWTQLDDEIKKSYDDDLEKVIPSVEVGTLTGHVNYDLVDNKVVSFGNDWTTLNLGGQTYQMPDGTEVVNGIIVGTDLSWGEKLKEHILKYFPDIDPDYVTRPWHGYLSVNKSNIDPDYAGFRLVGNEPNALAKATDDRAATAIEMTNKTIDLSLLRETGGDGVGGLRRYDFNEQDGQLRAKATFAVGGFYIPYVEKTATRTINVTAPDGKTSTVKQTATLAKHIDFNKDDHPDWITGEWTSYDVPVIPGYTATQLNVSKEAVTGTTKDQTVNITYTANPQTTTVVYQTEDGTSVHTTTVNGQTGQTVKVLSEVPAGWVITKGKVPSEITFGADGHEPIEVTVDHRHVTVTPDQPQNNGTKLPDNPTKTFNGVETNDLNKTITRTIEVTTPDGKSTTTKQTVMLTRTADVDEVTGEVKYGAWTTGQWDVYQVPVLKGYTASQTSVETTPVDENTKDQMVEVSYTPNKQSTTIKYVDDNGEVVHTTTVDGVTDQTVKVPNEVPAGWMITKGEVPSEITFDTDGHEPVVITISHRHVTVTPDQPQENGTKLPDNPAKTFEGVEVNDLNKTIIRAIKVTTPDGQTKTVAQTAKLTRNADVDEVTGEVTYGKWTTGQWDSYEIPVLKGYTASQASVEATSVDENTKDQTVEINYTPNKQSTTIKYVDDKGQVVHTTTVDGVTAQNVKVPNEVPAGWTIVKGEVPSEITFGADGYDPIEVTVNHRHITVTPGQPQNNGTKLPDNSTKTFNGVETGDLNKTITRTIKVTTPDGQTKTVVQTVKLTRNADVDEVTGEVTYGKWSTGQWDSYEIPALKGYTASQASVEATPVDENTKDQTVDISYTANIQTTHINYVDGAGKTVHTTIVTGKTDETVNVPNEVPAGWKITKGEVPSEISFGPNGHADETITIGHQHVTVDPDHPQNNGMKLPDNPAKTFEGVEANDLNKTIIRTIKVTTPNGKTTTTKQTAKLTRTADVDEVTGEVTYGKWTTGEWAAYDAPSVAGYTPSQTTVAKESVTATSNDTTVEITYQPMQHQISVEYVDDDDHGKVVKTDQVPGKTDQTITVTPSAPANYDLVDNGNRTYTVTSNDAQVVQIHVKHHQVTTSESKTVTRTINVHTPHDGTKVVKQNAELTRKVTTDQVTGEKTYGDWTTGQWESYTPEAIPGYTPSTNEVPNTNVNGNSKNQMVDVTYTADAQKLEIVYVDDTKGDAAVKTDQIAGKTDETVKVTPDVPAGYELVGKVPGDYTMTAGGHQTITVHLVHQMKTVSESKTVTRTINVHTPHDGAKTIKQTAELTRDVTTDQVTGEKTYGDWSTAEWDRYAVPAIAGYVPSVEQVAQQVVNGITTDQIIDVTYSSGEHTTHINYVDGDGNIVHTTTIKGQTDGTAQVPNETPAGWTVVGEPVPTELAFGPDGHSDVTVTVDHQHVTVTPDQPKTPTDKLPDNPAKMYPNGVGNDNLNKTITRTIKIVMPDGQTKTVAQTAHLTRTADVDEVTGEVTYGKWTTGEWSNYDVPTVPGYTPSQSEVPAQTVSFGDNDVVKTVTYKANTQKLKVVFIDDTTGKTLNTIEKAGLSDTDSGYNTKAVISDYAAKHYDLVSDGTNGQNLAFDHDDGKDQHYEVHLVHATHPIDEQVSTKQTIHYQLVDGTKVFDDHTAQVDFSRDGYNDEVTNENHWNKWTPSDIQTFSKVVSPVKLGYTPDKASVAAVDVHPSDKNVEETVIYSPDKQVMTINYIDDVTGKTLSTKQITGFSDASANYNTKSSINSYVAGHCKLVSDDTNSDNLVFDHDDSIDQVYNVHLTHSYQKVDDHKSVNETVHYIYDDGQTARPDYKAPAINFSRTGTKDLVTSNIVWNAWTPAEQSFDQVTTPAISGYTPDVEVVPSVNVSHGSDDLERTVIYHADDQTILVNYIDDDTHSTLKTDTVIGKTAQKSNYTTKKSIDGYIADHYKLVSDDTNDNELVFDSDSTKAQVYNVHLKHVHQNVSDSALVNETIHYVYADGSKARNDYHAPVISFKRTGDKDLVTNAIVWNDWIPASQDFKTVDSPVIDGYTPSQKTISNITVKPGDKDIDQIVVYAPDTQSIVVNYIDDVTGKTLKTDTLTGKSDRASDYTTKNNINGYENQHYVLVSDDTQGKTLIFDHDDKATQVYNVHLSHQTEPASQSRIVHETINYVYADGSKASDTVTAKPLTFTQTGVKDLVTNAIAWNDDWTSKQTFAEVKSPEITGYTASRTSVGPITVDHNSSDIHQTVIYTANDQTARINYIDDVTGKTLETDSANGKFGDQINFGHDVDTQIKVFEGQGYKFKSNSFNGQKYQADNSQNEFEIHFTHGTQNVSRTNKVTETVKYQFADGRQAQKDHVQTVEFTQHGVQDLVTKTTVWTPSDPQTFASVDTPHITGYTSDIQNVPAATVNFGDEDIVKTVTYKANQQKLDVVFIDDVTGQVLKTANKIGLSDTDSGYNTKDDISDYAAKHYDLVSDGTNGQNLVFDHDDDTDQHYEVHLTHHKSDTSRQSTVNETIHYVYENSKQAADDYVAKPIVFTQTGVKDLVTGDTDWNGQWTSDQEFKAVNSPEITGYTPSRKTVDAIKVSHDTSNIKRVVTYVANNQVAKITYIDDVTGKVLATDEVSGKFGSRVDYNALARINSFEKQGYQLKTNGFDQPSYQADDTKNQFEIRLIHQLNKTSRESTVTRTISYVDSITGLTLHQPIIQTLKFIEDGVTDLVTNETTWQTASRQQFVSVKVPEIKGYASELSVVEPAEVGFGDANIETTVKYKKLDVTNTISYVDSQGKVIKTDTVSGQSGTEIKLDVPSGYHLVDNQTKVTISENETKQEVMIAKDDVTNTISYVDSQGKVIKTDTVSGQSGTEIKLDVPSGYHLVDNQTKITISENNSTQTVKITKDNSANKIAQHLPQTGNQRETGLVALGFAAGLLGLVVLRKKRN